LCGQQKGARKERFCLKQTKIQDVGEAIGAKKRTNKISRTSKPQKAEINKYVARWGGEMRLYGREGQKGGAESSGGEGNQFWSHVGLIKTKGSTSQNAIRQNFNQGGRRDIHVPEGAPKGEAKRTRLLWVEKDTEINNS